MLVRVNRPHLLSRVLAGAGALGVALLGALSAHAGPLPTLPDPNGPPAPPPAATPGPGAAPRAPHAAPGTVLERARRGIVTVERDNKLLGVGSVLSGDGRILTALSMMAGVDSADVRYADGNTVKVRVGHRDSAWDLALLVPLTGKWLDGLTASEADPGSAELKTFVARGPRMLGVVPTVLKGRTEARARAGEVLPGALDFDIKGGLASVGAPILDGNGSVIGVFMQGCKVNDAGACMPMTLGAPVYAIRRFLAATPATAVAPPPWLGIRGESDAWGSIRGVRVIAVANGSPADKGGLKANLERAKGDLIVAVNGAPVDTAEKLAETIGKHSVGDSVKLLVFGGAFRELTVVLRAAPDPK